MPIQVGFKVRGLKELDAKLKKLGKAAGKKALRGAMMFATMPALKKAKAITPVGIYKPVRKDRKSGSLKEALRRRALPGRQKDKYTMAVRLNFNAKKAFYWGFVTGGTKPHNTSRGSKRIRSSAGRRQRNNNRMHPGTKGVNVLGVAFRVTKSTMLSRFTSNLVKKIKKAS